MTALTLSALTACLVLVAGPRLARAQWVLRAPALAIFMWQMLCVTTVLGIGLIGATPMLHWDNTHSAVCQAWQLCLDALRGAHGSAAQAAAVLGAALLALLATRLFLGGWRQAGAEWQQRRMLRTIVNLTGNRLPGLNITVVPSVQPAAFLLPGERADVVLTSAAVHQLDGDELHAVGAHERAHAAGRHYWLLRIVQLLQRALPCIPLFALAERQVHRLVELWADDVAIRSSRPLSLARALVVLAEGRSGSSTPGMPALLAADGGDTAERLSRLLQPPEPMARSVTRFTAIGAALMPLLPVTVALLQRSSTLW